MQARLQSMGVDGALFVLPIDVYYFSGTRQNSTLWIPADGEPILMVRKSLARAKDESALTDIRLFPSSKDFSALFGEQIMKIGFTFDVAPVQQLNYYTKLLPGREFVDISTSYREVRSVKSAFELEQLRVSGRSLCTVFNQVPHFLKEGMRELDLAAEFEHRLRIAGNEGFIRMRAFNQELFMGLALSTGAATYGFFDGAVTGRGLSNASPQGASRQKIGRNEPVFVDYTGVFNGYITDMTRIFVIGDLDPEMKRAFELSLEIQAHLQNALKPGAICEELFQQAVVIANKGGLGSNFMGMPGEQARFVGHGVGLELDELPVLAQGLKSPLQAGQVIAIEPKFVFPDRGVIGIENTFVVSSNGGEKITDIDDRIVYI
jgi:Xaa-Pro aminopeptidase